MQRTSRMSWPLLVLAVLLAMGGCQAGNEEAGPYPILDSGFPASTIDKLYWLDDDRVIFVSYGPKPKSVQEAEKNPRVPGIYIWDTRTNKVSFYTKGSKLCYGNGHISYFPVETVPDDPAMPVKVYWREGPLERTELKVLRFRNEEEYRVWYRAHVQNPHTCRWVERPEYAQGKATMPLREGDGWLVSSKQGNVNEPGEWLLHRSDGSVITTGAPTNLHMVSWVEFASQYFLFEYADGRPKRGCMRYWWIRPNGATDRGCQDIEPILGEWKGNVGLHATPIGVLVVAVKLAAHDRIGGFYLVEAGKAKLILKYGGTWSPDGCKSVYVDVPGLEGLRVGGQGDSRLQMIDVCETKENGR